jgi:hypothetical protein
VIKRFVAIACFAALSGVSVGAQSDQATIQGDHAKIQGVWRLVEETRPDVKQPTTPCQASLWIFTGKHHAIVGEFCRDKPRPSIPDSSKATVDDLRANWDPMYMRAGTYEIEPGNVFVERNFVSKGASAWIRWSYKLDGDTLTVTNIRSSINPVVSPTAGTWKFTKVE